MAIKNKYIPFLKFKTWEVAGLSVLGKSLQSELTPFLDLVRKDGMTRADFEAHVSSCRKKADKYLSGFKYLFIDTFDVPDAIAKGVEANCRVVIDEFLDFEYVPVLGLDRALNHNSTILQAKADGEILSDIVALRLQVDDFASFELVEDELLELIEAGDDHFNSWIVIFDCRVCLTSDRNKLATDIANFVLSVRDKAKIDEFIIVGSSVPASITHIARPSDESLIARAELEIFHEAEALVGEDVLALGDYTIISPTYTELTIAPELLLSVTAPKVFYAYKNYHYIARGGRIKTQGYGQYDDICEEIVGKPFFRNAVFSWGDLFIQQRADGHRDKNVTPATILKPTICAHIEYMARQYPV